MDFFNSNFVNLLFEFGTIVALELLRRNNKNTEIVKGSVEHISSYLLKNRGIDAGATERLQEQLLCIEKLCTKLAENKDK